MIQPKASMSLHKGGQGTDRMKLALVSISLESALLGKDAKAYETVVRILKERHGCTLADCYRHPEYLNMTLKILPKNLRSRIVESVQRSLGEFSHVKSINRFLNALDQ